MSPGIAELVQEALGVAVMIALPFVVAAVAGSLVAGLLQWLVGFQDPVVGTIARGVAVIVALMLFAGPLTELLRAYVHESWAELPGIGRAG